MSKNDPLDNMIRHMFPHYRSYPVNAMVPALIQGPQGPRLAMLAVGDAQVVDLLINDEEDHGPVSLAYLEDNKYGVGRDLVLRFELECTGGAVALETNVPGDEQKAQGLVVGALQEAYEIGIFVVDEDRRELIRILKAPWDPAPWKELFALLENAR